ncbi:hypothetical protein IPL68_06045 [Candidatus Saccharibacteria bacterium]|nr:MAG: hypothetical protein IPL68_06045 [Candidatus Saccharibacteria bacterium]
MFYGGSFYFSLRHGFANIVRSDNYYLAAALLGLIPWAITHDPTFSVIIAVAIDLTASTMTIRKTWRKPASETPVLYGANVLRHILTLFSLQSYNIATTLHSIAMLATNTTMTSIIVLKKPRTIAGKNKP